MKEPLRIVYQDHNSRFDELFAKDGSFKTHERNLRKLLIEMLKVMMKFAPEIVNEVFDIIECPYPLRNELIFKTRNIRTVSKDVLLNRIEHEYLSCDTNLVINGRF